MSTSGQSQIIIKPWGFYEDYFRSDQVVFKKLVIKPGHSISYQRHKKREEFWYIAEGSGVFKFSNSKTPTIEYSTAILEVGRTIEIISGLAHQITNSGQTDLVIYEMQNGECFEEDIERLVDPYNR